MAEQDVLDDRARIIQLVVAGGAALGDGKARSDLVKAIQYERTLQQMATRGEPWATAYRQLQHKGGA